MAIANIRSTELYDLNCCKKGVEIDYFVWTGHVYI